MSGIGVYVILIQTDDFVVVCFVLYNPIELCFSFCCLSQLMFVQIKFD